MDKLHRKNRWGKSAVPREAFESHMCKGIEGHRAALDELVAQGLVLCDNRTGNVSLNTAKKADIEALIAPLRDAH